MDKALGGAQRGEARPPDRQSHRIEGYGKRSGQALFIPRDRAGVQQDGLAGQIGGLEVLGEFVFSSPVEKTILDKGSINYADIEERLARVRTPLYED